MSEPLTFEPVAPPRVLLAKLRKAQAPDGLTSMGEMFAMAVLAKTQPQLRKLVAKLDRELQTEGKEMVNAILAASESLKTRLQLVDSAFARLCVVVEALDDADKRKGRRGAAAN